MSTTKLKTAWLEQYAPYICTRLACSTGPIYLAPLYFHEISSASTVDRRNNLRCCMHVDHQTNNLLAGFTSSCALGARGGRHKQQGTTRVAAAAAAHMATCAPHDHKSTSRGRLRLVHARSACGASLPHPHACTHTHAPTNQTGFFFFFLF